MKSLENSHIVDVYTTKRSELCVTYYKDNVRQQRIIPYNWYFYISAQDFETYSDRLYSVARKHLYYNITFEKESDKWVKIYCKYSDRSAVIDLFKSFHIQTYEADLSLNRRMWIDSNSQIATPEYFKMLFIDIEVDDSVSGLRIGHDRIISFAAKNSDGREWICTTKNEKLLLTTLINLVSKYDIVSGWNSRKYDIPYIKERCKLYNLRFPNICHIDMMQRMIHAYRFDTNIVSFSLNNIAEKFLGEHKVHRDIKTMDLYNTDFKTFKEYNLTDVRLLYDLEKKHKILHMLLLQSLWCNVTPRSLGQGGTGLYTLLDTVILRETHKRGLKGFTPKYTFDELKSMDKKKKDALNYVGGRVLKPVPGYYRYVYIFDFHTMYPSIILSSNIGFDTLDPKGEIHNPSGTRFKKEPISIFSVILKELLKNRKKYKERKLELIEQGLKGTPEYQTVEADEVIAKELGNSVYGICGAKWGRYFDKDIVESVTKMGHWLLGTMIDFFSARKYTIISGDTDSIMVSANKKVDSRKILEEYHVYLYKRLKDELHITQHIISLGFDKYFKTFLIVAKKNYAGRLTNQEGRKVDYIFVRGLNSVKSDTCKLVKKLTNDLLKMLLLEDHDEKFYKDWLTHVHDTIFDNVKPEDISIHKKIRKSIEEYKNKPLSVVIAEKRLKNGDALVTREVEYIVTGRLGTKLNGVDINDFTGSFDKDYYWDNLILPNIARLLNPVFKRLDWSGYTYQYMSTPKLF